MGLVLKDSAHEDIAIVEASGHLDGNGAPDMERHCIPLLNLHGSRLVFDFAGLDYISSAGLRSLLVLAKKARAVNGSLAICNPSPMVREVMEISGFDKLLKLTDSRESALAAVR